MVTVWELWTTALTMIVAYLSSAQGSDTPCNTSTLYPTAMTYNPQELATPIPPQLQNVVQCDSSRTECWTAALFCYWDDPQFTVSVAYVGAGAVTWTRTAVDGSVAPFICDKTSCSNSTYQTVHYVNITLTNPFKDSESGAIYTANVTNDAGFNTSSTQVNLLCPSIPDPPTSSSSITLQLGSVGNITCPTNVDTKYTINVCYTNASTNVTNCSSCLEQSSGPCTPALPAKPHWSISSTVGYTQKGCTQRSVTIIIDGVRNDDSGTINYYYLAVTPELYQTYSVSVDNTTVLPFARVLEVGGGALVMLVLIVVGVTALLCVRRSYNKVPTAAKGQIQSETQPLLVETGTLESSIAGTLHQPQLAPIQHQQMGPSQHPTRGSLQHPTGASLQHPNGGSLQYPTRGSLQHPTGASLQHPNGGSLQYPTGGSLQHPTGGSLQHPTRGSLQHPTGGSLQHPTRGSLQHPTVGSQELQEATLLGQADFTPWIIQRSYSNTSQCTAHVSLVPEEDEHLEDV